MEHGILIVDNSDVNRAMLRKILSGQYAILEACNAKNALSLLHQRREDVSLVLMDLMTLEPEGSDALAELRDSGSQSALPIIMIAPSADFISKAYAMGASDCISRPFDEATVRYRVQNTIMLYAKQKRLEQMLIEQIWEKESNTLLMVEVLSNIVEFRNGESGLHVLHIRTITELLLRHLSAVTDRYPLTLSQIALIVNASALHDIGKMTIPEAILNKPDKLTDEEYAMIKTHTVMGAKILDSASNRQNEALVQAAHDICRWHHERYDGRGYPDGLLGEEIPISAQVVSLADAYDALTSKRGYKPPFTHETALRMILNGECGAFNPLLLQCLVEVGPYIADELTKSMTEQLPSAEISHITSQLMDGISSRTLALLEQERVKYDFLTAVSTEILFEYSEKGNYLTICDWGAHELDISTMIPHPLTNPELTKLISSDRLKALYELVTHSESPITKTFCTLTVRGQARHFRLIARPLWVDEKPAILTGIIGKLTDDQHKPPWPDGVLSAGRKDALTDLHTPMAARNIIERSLVRKEYQCFAMILLDIDCFKELNDLLGQRDGDELLKQVGRKIAENIRKNDVAARIGGDEFMVFLSSQADASRLVDRLFHAVCSSYSGRKITISMGAALGPTDGGSYEILFRKADQALYAAKARGKNQCVYYDSSTRGVQSVLSPMDRSLDE